MTAKLGPFFYRHRAIWIMTAAGAVLMAGVGAFDTGEAALWTLYSYWLSLMLGAGLVLALALERFEAKRLYAARPLLRASALTLWVAVLMTPPVWIMAALAMNGSWHPLRMVELLPQVILVSAALVALQLFPRQRLLPVPAAHPPRMAPVAPPLIARLPDRLREAELLAIEAEDHYLRIHTDRGSVLVLMSLRDAIEELREMEGAQTHRSWWVARRAVLNASRGRGRALLKLKGGLSVPVSRTYSPELRRAGWY